MAQIGHFNAAEIDPYSRPAPVPADKYIVVIVSSEMRTTKDATGSYLQLELEIQEGQFAHRKVVERLNLNNSNEQAVQIAQRALSQICHAVNVLSVSDSEQLHGRRMIADVRVEAGRGQYGDSNRVFAYYPIDGSMPVGEVAQATSGTKPGNGAKPGATARPASNVPWRRAAE